MVDAVVDRTDGAVHVAIVVAIVEYAVVVVGFVLDHL